MIDITLRPIDESNLSTASIFNLETGRINSYPTPYAAWLKPMFTVINASPSECTPAIP